MRVILTPLDETNLPLSFDYNNCLLYSYFDSRNGVISLLIMHELFQLYDKSYFNSIMKVKITKLKRVDLTLSLEL